MSRFAGFSDLKGEDANEVAMLAFRLGIGFFVLCLVCMLYVLLVEENWMGILLCFAAVGGEVVIMKITLGHAKKISTDAEKNDTDSVKVGKVKGKKQGYTLFTAFVIIALVMTAIISVWF